VELKKVRNSKVFGYIGAQGAAVVSLKSNNMDELAVTGSIRIYIK